MIEQSPAPRIASSEYFKKKSYETISVETQNGARLEFCGIKHSNDPDSDVIMRVRHELGGFIGNDSQCEKLVLLEGFNPERVYPKDESEAIRQSGEIALAAKMARDAGVEIMSPEPPLDIEFSQLCEEFPPEQVFYWIVARQADQWSRENPLPAWHKKEERQKRKEDVHRKFENYVSLLSETLGEIPSFPDIAESFVVMNQVHQELFGGKFDWNKTRHFTEHTNPYKEKSVINQIMKRSNEIRDQHIAKTIKEALVAQKDVFALYGDGHAYALEPILKSFSAIEV